VGSENLGRLIKKVHLKKPIDVDKIPIRRDSFLTNAYAIEFPLDSQPSYEWQAMFEQEWKSSLLLWERKVVVVGDRLHLVTTPNEIGEKIDWLKRMIEAANSRVEELNKTQKIIEKQVKAEELRKHENIIRDSIRIKMALD
jgi:hypothetical protein